jgi:hypothetical protein
MNEKIKALWEETTITTFPRDGKYASVYPEHINDFARAIIKECVLSIEKTIETKCDTDSEKMGCEFAITDLLQMLLHVGVEE